MLALQSASGCMRRQTWWLLSLAALVVGLVGVAVLSHHPPGSPGMPGCLFRHLTGLFCTGCGVTRASYALIQGDLGRALEMNPLAVAMAPIGLALWLHEGLGRPRQWERVASHLRDARLWMVVILLFTVARNLPWPPFSWLAPG